MIHLHVSPHRFARSEFVRGLQGVGDEAARKRFPLMNCISWMIGHVANQEHFLWVFTGQGLRLAPELNERVGFGKPASTPPLAEMWDAWRVVTASADDFLDTLTTATLQTRFRHGGKPWDESIGTLLYRNIYHYWFHTGLPQFVGDMSAAIYQAERG